MRHRFLRGIRAADTDTHPQAGASPIIAPPATANATGQLGAANGGSDKTFTQAELDRIIDERLARAKTKAETDAAKVKADAEQKALMEQGEWKTLAEQRAQEAADAKQIAAQLEPTKAELSRYKKGIETYAASAKQGLDAGIVALLDKLDPLDQLEWLATNKPASTVASVGTPRPLPTPVALPAKPELRRPVVKL